MKSETQVRRELELQEQDLKVWQDKYERVPASDATRKLILGNTLVSVEEHIAALKWVLEED